VPPAIPSSAFDLDPEVKEEYVWHGQQRRPGSTLLTRKAGSTWVTRPDGEKITYPASLSISESVLSQLHEPHLYPELSALRHEMLSWRFYHEFRTDSESLMRYPQVGIRTPVVSNNGNDVASALQTIIEIGDVEKLHDVIDCAFPGSRLLIDVDGKSRFQVLLQMPGISRPLEANELSDGTLRYLCLVAALLSPRPSSLLALNEPEMSLHPELLTPLAELIADASKYSQMWVTTHSKHLAQTVSSLCREPIIELGMGDEGTYIVD